MNKNVEIAIIGVSGMFPGAKNVENYWNNINNKVYSIVEAPEEWSKPYFDPNTQPREDLARIYTRQVGLLGNLAEFNPLEFGIPPSAMGGDPSHFLALKTAQEALKDANYEQRAFNRERTGIILGRGSNPNRGDVTGLQYGVVLDQTIDIIGQLLPELNKQDLNTLRENLKSSLPPAPMEQAPTLVSNVASGRIANRLDLMGPNYLIDAACASALISVQLAMEELINEKCDMMLAGGIQASMPPVIYQLFCQLNALSRTRIQPFSKNSNGTLLGEGAGFLVLKRLSDAEKDGDRIYAIIKGVGMASDGKALGLLAPRLEGEILAIQRAYEATGIDCQTIDLIEAHGTGIPLGDETEIKALTTVFGERIGNLPKIALGSVKSMIGHCIPASGIASLIKMTLSVYYKTLPPTLCDEINPNLNLENSPFYLNTETRPWIHGENSPRRCAVNAFGFGGINTHAIIEEYQPKKPIKSVTKLPIQFQPSAVRKEWNWEIIFFSAQNQTELRENLEKVSNFITNRPDTFLADLAYTLNSQVDVNKNHRLSILASDIQDFQDKINQFLANNFKSQPRQQIFYNDNPTDLGKIAFVFASEGAQYSNMLREVCLCFPQVRQWFDVLDESFPRQNPPSHYIFPAPTALTEAQKQHQENQLYAGDLATESLFASSMGIYELLCDLGIEYDVILGHSAGEHTAATASYLSQVEDKAELIYHLRRVNQIYRELEEKGEIPTGLVFSVGGLTQADIDNLLTTYQNSLFLVADNCPNQMLMFAKQEESQAILKKMQELGAIYMIQPFNRAYHTPLFAESATALKRHYQDLKLADNPQSLNLYSCATTDIYPHSTDDIRNLAVDQWSMPVRFQETIKKLYENGIKTFIEIGAGNNLTAFIDNILRGKNYQAWATNTQKESSLKTILSLLAKLFINGYSFKIDKLYQHRQVTKVDLDQLKNENQKPSPILNLLLPKMELKSEFAEQLRAKLNKNLNTINNISNSSNEQNYQQLNTETNIKNNYEQKSSNLLPHQQLNNQLSVTNNQEVKSIIVQQHFQLMQEFLANQNQISDMIFTDNNNSDSI